MTQLFYITERVLNRPLLLTPDKAQVILSVITNRTNLPEANRFENEPITRDEDGRIIGNPFPTQNGIAIISIIGSLVNRGAWIGASSGLVSYEGLTHQIKTAMHDNKIQSVVLDIQSSGGEAVGCFELAAQIRRLATKKKVIAVVNGMACSAAYALASASSEIVTTETGICGSIGVVLLHTDFSRQMDLNGVTPTIIHAGAHKADGNPFEPLSQTVKADLQTEVDMLYSLFLKHVSKGRGNRLTAAAARKTEARTFIGVAAVEAGLADRVGTFDEVLAELTRVEAQIPVQKRRHTMLDNKEPALMDGGTQSETYINQDEHHLALAQARQEGETVGEKKAMARIHTIMSADGIKDNATRIKAALALACEAPSMESGAVINFIANNVQQEGSRASLSNRLAADSEKDKLFSASSTSENMPLTAIAKQMNGEKYA